MKSGTILNFAYPNFLVKLGNLIHYGKNAKYTHSGFVVFSDKNGVFVAEALDKVTGSYYENWWLDARFNDGTLAIGEIDVDEKKVKEFFYKHEGEKYDYMNLLDIFIYWITGRTNVRNTDNWICSELDCAMLKECSNGKIDIVKELNLPKDDYCSPMDLANSKQIKWRQN